MQKTNYLSRCNTLLPTLLAAADRIDSIKPKIKIISFVEKIFTFTNYNFFLFIIRWIIVNLRNMIPVPTIIKSNSSGSL